MVDMPRRVPVVPVAVARLPRARGSETSAERRGSSASRGYGWRWMHTARAFRREHAVCCCCAANGRTSAAEVVDHIVPHRGDDRLFWDRRNWQPLCSWCHNNLKGRLEVRYETGEIGADMLRLDRVMPEYFSEV